MRRIESAEGIERRGRVLALLTFLKQICNHPAQYLGEAGPLAERSGKLGALSRDARGGGGRRRQGARVHAVPRDGRTTRRTLGARRSASRSSSCTAARHAKRVTRWCAAFKRSRARPRVFVLSVKAGGTGLNLTAANHVFHFDRWWNPAVEDQATDRAYRIGQRRAVQVHKLVCAGTVEEKVDRLLEQKRSSQRKVVGSGESWITELGNDRVARAVLACTGRGVDRRRETRTARSSPHATVVRTASRAYAGAATHESLAIGTGTGRRRSAAAGARHQDEEGRLDLVGPALDRCVRARCRAGRDPLRARPHLRASRAARTIWSSPRASDGEGHRLARDAVRGAIALAQLPATVWTKAIAAMAAQAQFAAELLAGQMPQEIDAAFHEAGASVFPAKRLICRRVQLSDWANPCKHVAATHYVLGEALDRDPFLLFELRGRTKEQVLEALRAARAGAGEVNEPPGVRKRKEDAAAEEAVPSVSLSALTAADYDKPRAPIPSLHLRFEPPPVSGAVLRQFGTPAAWSDPSSPADMLAPILHAAAEEARRLALAEPERETAATPDDKPVGAKGRATTKTSATARQAKKSALQRRRRNRP